MENQTPKISERELAERIIYLHDIVGLGFRKIVKKLRSEDIGTSKDRAFRLYHKYKPVQVNTEEIVDDETEFLNREIMEHEQNVKLTTTKNEKRKRIVALMVQESEASLERREELFGDKAALLDFAQKVLPYTNPALWLRFTNLCNTERIDMADALLDAIGNQVDYERARMQYTKEDRDYLLDEYLCLQIEDWLSQQQEEKLEEEAEDSVDDEPNITIHVVEVPKEYVRIPLALGTSEWVDSQGFFHILISPDEEHITIPLSPVEYEEIDL